MSFFECGRCRNCGKVITIQNINKSFIGRRDVCNDCWSSQDVWGYMGLNDRLKEEDKQIEKQRKEQEIQKNYLYREQQRLREEQWQLKQIRLAEKKEQKREINKILKEAYKLNPEIYQQMQERKRKQHHYVEPPKQDKTKSKVEQKVEQKEENSYTIQSVINFIILVVCCIPLTLFYCFKNYFDEDTIGSCYLTVCFMFMSYLLYKCWI